MMRVAVVGAGRGGRALIQFLGESPEVQIVSVADVDAEAPGLRLARERGIPTVTEHQAVFRYTPEVVIEVTGKPEVLEDLLRERPAGTEVIGARSARLLWDFIEAREQTARRLETLLLLCQSLSSTLHLETVFDLIAEAAANLLEAEAVGLWVIPEDAGEPVLRASAGTAELSGRPPLMLSWAEGLGREVSQGKGGVPRAETVAPLANCVWVPLMKEGRVLGVLGVRNCKWRPFTEGDLDLLDSFASQASIALENARLYEEGRSRGEQLVILREVVRALNAEPSLEVLLERLVERARELVGARYGALGVLDEEGRIAQFLSAGLTQAERERIGPVPQGRGLLGVVLRGGSLVRLDDIAAHPQSSGFPPHHPPMRNLLGVPILIRGRVGGALYLTEKPGGFTKGDEDLLVTLAADAAVAIEKTRLLGETRRQHQEAVALEAVAREITSSLERTDVFQRIVARARELCGSDLAFLAPYDQENGTATIVAVSGALSKALLSLTITRGRGTGGKVLETGEPFATEDYLNDPRITKDYADVAIQEGFAAQAVVPLRFEETITGLLWVVNRTPRRFTPRDVAVLTRLADQAAIALENSRLYGELRAALEKVEGAQQQLVQGERLRALGEMAGGVAHDFNNILATILGRAQILLSQVGDPEVQRQLQVIKKVAGDGARTVQRIQEFTRMRRARPFHSVDLNRVIEEVVELTRSRWKDEAQAQGLPYDVRVEAAPLPPVAGDPSELREALTNIVFNALDAMPDGGRVTFRTGVEGERVSCVVTDTGVGMTEEVRQRIFDPFFTTKGEKGNGLGLSVVYGIIVRHGGEIEVQSQVGQGSAFTIRLPVAREIPEAPEMAPPPQPHGSAKILVIDDDEEVREVLAEMLASQGHAVATCADGESGLTRLGEEPFDLVVTDLAMPGLTGWQVAGAVKSRNPKTPVALVTGWGDRIDPDEARAKGVDFLVAKPFKLEDVTAVVARALTLGKLGKG